MSDENDEEGSVWDEIDEFTSAEPTDEEQVVDAEIVDRDERRSASSRTQSDDREPMAHEASHDGEPRMSQADREPLGENATHEGHANPEIDPQAAEPSVGDTPADVSAADAEEPLDAGEPVTAEEPLDAEEPPDADEVFDEMDVSDVDGEALWEELASGGSATDANAAAEPAATEPSVDQSADRPVGEQPVGGQPTGAGGDTEETLVDKRQYCQQCPYFTEPPEVGCTHPGTEIVEVVEDGRFRVRDCPVVTETGPDRTVLDGGD